jgi:hypothetical protein
MDFDRDGVEKARRLGVAEAEVNSAVNLAFDHVRAGNTERVCSAIRSAESILAQDSWFRWRFDMRLQAARAEQTLLKPDVLCLLEKATQYGARKYMITGRTMLAKIAMAEGDMATAEAELNSALAILHEFPAPLVAWKTWSMLGRLHAALGREVAARAAYGEAASVISQIAGSVSDERLRGIFLDSAAVREALECGAA